MTHTCKRYPFNVLNIPEVSSITRDVPPLPLFGSEGEIKKDVRIDSERPNTPSRNFFGFREFFYSSTQWISVPSPADSTASVISRIISKTLRKCWVSPLLTHVMVPCQVAFCRNCT